MRAPPSMESPDPSHTAAGGPPGTISSRELAQAAGGPGATSSRVTSHAAGGPGVVGISPRALAHAAARGPAAISSRDIGCATGGPSGVNPPLDLSRAAEGGPGAIPTRDIGYAAGGRSGVIPPRDLSRAAEGGPGGLVSSRGLAHAAAGGTPGVIPTPGRAHAAGGPGGGSGPDLAYASARMGTPTAAVVDKVNGGRGAGQVDGDSYSHQGAQGGREVKAGQAGVVGSKATAGPGRALALAASLHTHGTDATSSSSSHVAPSAQALPLVVVHDRIFVAHQMGKGYDMLAGVHGDDEWSTDLDVSKEITAQLTQGDTAIVSFTVDSSDLPDSAVLEKWLDLVSARSVQRLSLLNLGLPVYRSFPIQSVQSKALHTLRLGFFIVSLDLLCFDYSYLHTLEFFSCQVEGKKLSWVVTDCPTLKVLKVHNSCVDLEINSESLLVLDAYGISGNRLVIASAPHLESLSCGILAPQKCAVARQRTKASVYLHNVPSLKYFNHLNLAYNKLILDNMDLDKDAIGPLPLVEELQLSLEMADPMQLHSLHKLLEAFPVLKRLNIKRLGSISSKEGFYTRVDKPFEDLGTVDCVKNSLRSFALQEFRGGDSELHLIKNILKNAPNLIALSTRRSEGTQKKDIRQAVKEIKSSYRASVDCRLSLE